VNRKVTCSTCKRDYPASKCEQSVRGYECTPCIRRQLRVALRKIEGIEVGKHGELWAVGCE